MASKTGHEAHSVIRSLLANPKRFSFSQAVRLLSLAYAGIWGGNEEFLRHGLRMRPDLSLAHPGTDVAALSQGMDASDEQENEEGRPTFQMTLTFLSLYGASSPLPSFYNEELLEEARQDGSASRDFLDIFNQLVYVLYFKAYNAYTLGLSLEQHDQSVTLIQRALSGLALDGNLEQAGIATSTYHPDVLMRPSHSAHALRDYIAAHVGLDTPLARGIEEGRSAVEIEQCLMRRVPVPQEQLARLSSVRLGEDVIGTSVEDQTGAFRIHLHGLDRDHLYGFLPEGRERNILRDAVNRYLRTPLICDLMLHVPSGVRRTGALGHTHLGRNAFLSHPERPEAARYRFNLIL